ncbi:NRAMP family divalent metal transporter [Gallicola sp. Sow4_E12]|uniref:NRAMP family divalent metal transporter n=1 Tax=Gallicola sp. Sow4_E12 TaxID=3438785 RepID=UPI003F937337
MKENSKNLSILLGAAFLMATSAIGPGFLTQTATYTGSLGATFGFVILISLLFSAIAQLNIWRVICVSKLRGQDIANKVAPGLGYFIAILVAIGGLVFNIGNVGGAAIGLQAIFGMDIKFGAAIGGILGILIFISKKAGSVMDRLTQVLGALMIVLILVVAVMTQPPIGQAIQRTFLPESLPLVAIITLIGGTVGGYITFSGGHRLVDAGIVGEENLSQVNRSAVMGMGVAAIVRVLLFLAVLGVVSKGVALDAADPAGSAFQQALGTTGYKIFGIVFLAAALSSIVGAAYTSISFLKTLVEPVRKNERLWTIIFIAFSTLVLIFVGQPAAILVFAGTVNGFILPIMLAAMLLASRKKSIVGEYKHSSVLYWLGWVVVILTSIMVLRSIYLLIAG